MLSTSPVLETLYKFVSSFSNKHIERASTIKQLKQNKTKKINEAKKIMINKFQVLIEKSKAIYIAI